MHFLRRQNFAEQEAPLVNYQILNLFVSCCAIASKFLPSSMPNYKHMIVRSLCDEDYEVKFRVFENHDYLTPIKEASV